MDKRKPNNILEDEETITIKPYKTKYLQIFKGNSYYLLDRYKYDINEIMMKLDLSKINYLGKIFEDNEEYRNEGVEKKKFIELLSEKLSSSIIDPMEQTNLVYGLYKFFCEIDFNGDGHMQWEEFTQFVIDTVEGDNDAKVDEKDDENQKNHFNEKQMIKYKRYQISTRIKDSNIHKRDVIAACFLPRLDMLLINEYGTNVIRIYNPKTGKNEKIFEIDAFLKSRNNFVTAKTTGGIKGKADDQGNNSNNNNNANNNINNTKNAQPEKTKSNTYSVLSMFQAQWNLIAICLSDNRILFFNFGLESRSELIYELATPILEKRCWYLPEHHIWFSSGCKLPNNRYYTLNELDLEFEWKNQRYTCLYNEGHPYAGHFCDTFPHEGEILDVIEIFKPMMILTACMDGKIRWINLNDKDNVKCWTNHTWGVRSWDYNPLLDSVGYVLSVGFEYYINIYCTDLSIEEAYKGRLEGHYAPVITCKFLSGSYMAVSVDDEGNVRIWDTRLKLCLQLIPTPKKNFKVVNLLNMPKYNKFIIYGNKMTFYDAKYREEEHKQKNWVKDENYPIQIDFNYYYQNFYVTTFKDVRIYNKEGKLFKCFKKWKDNEHFEPDTRIRSFTFENNYRKFYLGFSNGAVMQFNAGNGSLIKPINEEEIEKDGIQTYKYDHTKDVTSMYYYYDYHNVEENNNDDNFILLTTSYDSLINWYNEQDPEESEKLRTLRGGHTYLNKVNEINCLDFSKRLNLFATGSSDGWVVVWDFEMSKIDDICYLPDGTRDKINISALKFLDPFPILVVAYSDGAVYFWGVKSSSKYRGDCILRFRNYFKYGHKIELSSIKTLWFVNMELKDIPYDVPLKQYFDKESPFTSKKQYKPPAKVKKEKKKSMLRSLSRDDEYEDEVSEDEDLNLDIVPSELKHSEIIDDELDPERYKSTDKEKYFLFLGDSQGNWKAMDLKGVIKKFNIHPGSESIIKSTFNLLKKDDINVETILNHNVQQKQDVVFSDFLNMYQHVIRKEWKAHDDEITCMAWINEPLTFMTCSKDKFWKIWNMQCECMGVINTLPKLSKNETPSIPWKFRVNDEKILEREIAEVVSLFESVGIERIIIGSTQDKNIQDTILEKKDEDDVEAKVIQVKQNKKRFKLIDQNKGITQGNKEDEGKNNMNYEGLYVQDIQKKIENIIKGNAPEQGMNEMANMIYGYDKFKYKKKASTIKKGAVDNSERNRKGETAMNSNNKGKKAEDNKGGAKVSSSKNQPWCNYNVTDLNMNSSGNINAKGKNMLQWSTSNIGAMNKQWAPINEKMKGCWKKQRTGLVEGGITEHDNINNGKDNLIQTMSNIKTHSSNFHQNEFSRRFPLDQQQQQPRQMATFSNKLTGSRNKKLRIMNPKFRDLLLTEAIFRENIKKFELNDKSSISNTESQFYNNKKKIALPFISERIVFRRGETEKLWNYEFYQSSYKACCSINSLANVQNKSIKTNYNNNWKCVEQFTRARSEIDNEEANKTDVMKTTNYDTVGDTDIGAKKK